MNKNKIFLEEKAKNLTEEEKELIEIKLKIKAEIKKNYEEVQLYKKKGWLFGPSELQDKK